MKKSIGVLLCISLLCMCFTACGAPNGKMTEKNITATVDTAFEALQNFDTENLNKYVESDTLSSIMKFAEKYPQFAELGKAIFKNLTYEITEINIDEKTVTLSVKNKDLYDSAHSFAEELKSEYSLLQLLAVLSKPEFLDTKLKELCTAIDNAGFADSSIEITLTIVQDTDHLVFSFDEDAENGVSGGALSGIKEIYS